MRTRLISSAAVALALTALAPASAKAQIVYHPSINTTPYQYSNIYNNPAIANYYSALTPPSASYGYMYNYPGYSTYSYGWSNPYSNYAWSGYNTYPRYSYRGYRGYRRW